MIIQGMNGIGKSYLIGTIKNELSCQAIVGHSPLQLLPLLALWHSTYMQPLYMKDFRFL